MKIKKTAGLDEIPPEVWKTSRFDDLLLRYCNTIYNQNATERDEQKAVSSFSPLKSDLRFAKNYWGKNLTSIAAKIYNTLLLNCVEPEIAQHHRFWQFVGS